MKKIYLVERTDICDYDEHDGCVTIAETIEEAKQDALEGLYGLSKDKIICKLIGIANPDQEKGIVLDSYNAG